MFDPIAFPSARSALPSIATIADTTISGALVPNPTIKIPISKLAFLNVCS